MTFVKGQSGNPAGRPEGSKNNDTLAKEARRAIFDAEVSKMWLETIKNLRPEYLADQFMGKAPDKIEHSGEIATISLLPEIIEKAKAELKKRKTSE